MEEGYFQIIDRERENIQSLHEETVLKSKLNIFMENYEGVDPNPGQTKKFMNLIKLEITLENENF